MTEQKPTYIELPVGMTEKKLLETLLRSKKSEKASFVEKQRDYDYKVRNLCSWIQNSEFVIEREQRNLAKWKVELRRLEKAPQIIEGLDEEIEQLKARLEAITPKPVKKSKDPDENY